MSDESLQARSYKEEQLQGEVALLAEIAAEYKMHLGDVSPQVRSWLSSAKDTETLRKMIKLLSEHEERRREHEERMELRRMEHEKEMKRLDKVM